MSLHGGDALARGAHSAEFESGGSKFKTEAEYDRRVMNQVEFLEKYEISEEDYSNLIEAPSDDARWKSLKVRDGYVPLNMRDRKKTETEEPKITVTDRRPSYAEDPFEKATWTKELIESLTPQQYQYRYKEDPRFWEAVHKICPRKCPYTAFGDNVILERIPEKRHFLDKADVAAEKPLRCLVLVASKKAQEAGIQSGDTVMIRSFTGTGIKIEDSVFEVVPYQDILFKINSFFL